MGASGLRKKYLDSAPLYTEEELAVTRREVRDAKGPGGAVTSVGDDFLKDQIGQKDTQITELNDQLKRRDEQIMTMLERDRETNYLINGLQQALSQSLGIESPDRLRIRREGDNRPGTPPPPGV